VSVPHLGVRGSGVLGSGERMGGFVARGSVRALGGFVALGSARCAAGRRALARGKVCLLRIRQLSTVAT
jgi:hypothetical protein